MFGWFKKKPVAVSADYDDFMFEELGVARGKHAHKALIGRDTDSFAAECERKAQQQIQSLRVEADRMIPQGVANRDDLVEQQFLQLLIREDQISDQMHREADQALLEDQRHVEMMDALHDIRREVRDSSPVNMVKDFASQHPFLTGVLATELHRRLTSK